MKIPCGKIDQPCKFFVGLALVLCCAVAQAQPQQQQHRGGPAGRPPPMAAPRGPSQMAAPHGPPPNQPHGPPSGQPQRPPSGQSVRERWLAMPPDARQNFRRNAELWMQMTPEQRNLMRQRENMRRQILRATQTRQFGTRVFSSIHRSALGLNLATFKNAEKSNNRSGSKSKRRGKRKYRHLFSSSEKNSRSMSRAKALRPNRLLRRSKGK
jgi:hypothetical protein